MSQDPRNSSSSKSSLSQNSADLDATDAMPAPSTRVGSSLFRPISSSGHDLLGASMAMRDLTNTRLGDYQIEKLLGRGGMGEVYLATQISLGRQVAIKILRPDLLNNEIYCRRFENEARIAARLNHRNVVHIYAIDNIGGVGVIVMEFVPGMTLKDYLAKKGPPELKVALAIMQQATAAIVAAGELGLVHRDIKPENLLLTRKAEVKVADFGLCKDTDPNVSSITQLGTTMGTPMYMSPEQVQNRPLDHRSDLYSLGVTFYHLLSGNAPFRADTAIAVALKHVSETPVDLATATQGRNLPPELTRLVMKLLAKSPQDRVQTASELAVALAKIRQNLEADPNAMGTISLSTTSLQRNFPDSSAQETQTEPDLEDNNTAEPRSGESLGSRLSRIGYSKSAWAAAILLGLTVGSGLGWTKRAPNLLGRPWGSPLAQGTSLESLESGEPSGSAKSGDPSLAVGLWITDWSRIERKASAEEQYRLALFSSNPADREAAWLAVPGYHRTGAARWSSKAQVQLARYWHQVGDKERLAWFADELTKAASAPNQSPQLALMCQAAIAGLDGKSDGVLEILRKLSPQLADSGLAFFALEILRRAEGVEKNNVARNNLEDLRKELREKFQFPQPDLPDFLKPG